MMKKVIIVSFLILVVTLLLYVTFGKGPRNYRFFKKVEIGMSKSDVVEHMGQPGHIVINEQNQTYIYLYQPPLIYVSDQIEIVFDESDDRVIKLSDPQ
ncbi:hypothetical protein [Pontibacter virosus]|nr:hypothetical protein [Pontibacter virosus]